MKIVRVNDFEELSQYVCDVIENTIKINSEPCICLNSGGTHLRMYQMLVNAVNGGLDISKTTIFGLDEYVGPEDAVYSVRRYMKERFHDKITQQPKRQYYINGNPDNDLTKEIDRYLGLLNSYTRNLQLLGLGTNGHIGANEPGESIESSMFVATHKESTIQSTMELYQISRAEAPTQMLTLGFKEILEAEHILLAASGESKARAVRATIEDKISKDCPASYLRNHDSFTFVIDQKAASLLNE